MHRVLRTTLPLLLVLAACNKGPESEPSNRGPEVARVADERIYARDFVLNYEMGFPHLRQGENPRLVYLQRLIDEKLLALEGYRLGLHKESSIQGRIDDLRKELLVEAMFERYVNERVEVSDTDIRSAAQKDRVSFRIRYLPLPTLERALAARRAAEESSFEEVVRDFAASFEEGTLKPSDLESPVITWQDMHPSLLRAVEDLELHDVSQPVRYGGSYLLMQVIDIRTEPLGIEAADERRRYEQIVFQQKAWQKAREFIGETMGPLEVRIKARPFASLRDNLWRWHRDAPPQENLLRSLDNVDAPYADAIRSSLDEVLITTKDGDWTIRRFLSEYPIERYPLRYSRADAFETDVYDAIGLTLRDSVFVARARKEGLGRTAEAAHTIELWTDKWVSRALVQRIQAAGGSVEDSLEELQARLDVEISHAVLDTLSLSDPRSPGLMLFKGHTMRPAFPTVDGGR